MVLFKKEHAKHPHARHLNSFIRSNRWGKNKSVRITYRKENGEVSERHVTPIFAKKDVLVAHDHDKNGYRSFKIERIQKMEKTAFEVGFEKRAFGWQNIPLDTPEKRKAYKEYMDKQRLPYVASSALGGGLGWGLGTHFLLKTPLKASLGVGALGALSSGIGGYVGHKLRASRDIENKSVSGLGFDGDAKKLREIITKAK